MYLCGHQYSVLVWTSVQCMVNLGVFPFFTTNLLYISLTVDKGALLVISLNFARFIVGVMEGILAKNDHSAT